MANHFDHRWNSFYGTGNDDRQALKLDEKRDPAACAEPRYWIAEDGKIPTHRRDKDVAIPGVAERLAELEWSRGWLCGWRDVTNPNNERTAIPAFLPCTAVGHTFPLALPCVPPSLAAVIVATQSSMVVDFVSRQRLTDRHMKVFTWKQLPVPAPATLKPHLDFIVPRVLELVYTAYDMASLARDLGDDGGPFVWDEERRAHLRAELDAFFFRLYGIERDDVDYIMETFPIVKRKDEQRYGSFRTKELVLDVYDAMAEARRTGVPYQTVLDPPPGRGPRHPTRRNT